MSPKRRSPITCFIPLLLFSALLSLNFGVARASDDSPPSDDADSSTTFFEAIDVNIVNVDIIATDKDGERVPGLSAEAFRVFEDGKEMQLVNFIEVREGVQEEEFQQVAESQSTSGGDLLEFDHVEEPKGLQVLLFVDNRSLVPARRNSVFRDLETFIEDGMEPGDRLMVVSFNNEIQIEQRFTSDRDQLLKVVRELEKAPTQAAFSGSELNTLIREIGAVDTRKGGMRGSPRTRDISSANMGREANQLLRRVNKLAEEQYNQSLRSVGAVKESVSWMSAIEGKKALIYLGEGISYRPGELPMEVLVDRFGGYLTQTQGGSARSRLAHLDTTSEIKALTDYASSNRVAMYVIRSGREASSEISVEFGGEALGGNRTASIGAATRAAASLRESAEAMAGATGGLATTTSFSRVIDGIQEDFKSYYSLAYTPPRPRDRRSHSIRVEVSDPDLRLRHRREYKDRSKDEILSDLARAATLMDAPTNPLEVRIEFEEATIDEEGRAVVPIIVRLPISKLTLIPGERFHEGHLGFFVVATDSKGRSSPVIIKEVPIRVPNQELLSALGQLAGYRATLVMRDDDHVVAVGVQDRISHVTSAASAHYSPPLRIAGQ